MYFNSKIIGSKFFLILEFLLIFFIFFPYIKIFGIGFNSDTQPFFIIFAIIIIVIKIRKLEISRNFILLLPIILFVLLYFVSFTINEVQQILNNNSLSDDKFKFYRFFFNYLSFPLVYLACIQLKFSKKKIYVYFYFAVAIWFGVALIQNFIDASFLNSLLNLPRGQNSLGRGVLSLAPEPSIFAIQSTFLLLISFTLKTHFISLIIVTQCLLLSKSGTGVFVILICGVYLVNFLFQNYYKTFLILLTIFIISLIELSHQESENLNKYFAKYDSRLIRVLVNMNSKKTIDISKFDASIRGRYESINHGLKGFVNNNFLPNGVFNEYIRTYLYNPNREVYEVSENIMSCIFLMLFEIGFLTLFFIFFVVNNIKNYFKSLNDKIVFSIISFITLILPISPALPLFALLNAIWHNKKI